MNKSHHKNKCTLKSYENINEVIKLMNNHHWTRHHGSAAIFFPRTFGAYVAVKIDKHHTRTDGFYKATLEFTQLRSNKSKY